MHYAIMSLFVTVIFVSIGIAYAESVQIDSESLSDNTVIVGTLKERGVVFLNIYAENKTVYRMIDYSSINYPYSFQFQLDRPLRPHNTYSLDTDGTNSIVSLNITSLGKHSEAEHKTWLSTDKSTYFAEQTVRFFGAISSSQDHILRIEFPSGDVMRHDLSVRPDLTFYEEINAKDKLWENGRHLVFLENSAEKIVAIASFNVKADPMHKPTSNEITASKISEKIQNSSNAAEPMSSYFVIVGIIVAITLSVAVFWLLRPKGSKPEMAKEPNSNDETNVVEIPRKTEETSVLSNAEFFGKQGRMCALCNTTFANDEEYLEHQLKFHM